MLILGVGAQWIAWRIRVPSILLLLITGFLAGPILGRLDPDRLLGDLLFPFVSMSVAVIMFEGALSLRFSEITSVRRAVVQITTLGVAVTGVLAAVAAHWCAGLDWPLAVLFGALLTVTGPTVIGPLLRHVRPDPPAGTLLKWEGILTDPIGALLAVVVFQSIEAGRNFPQPFDAVRDVAYGIASGVAVGLAFGFVLHRMLCRRWVPDHLHAAVTLAFVLGAWRVANLWHDDTGLMSVTVMGIALANQKTVAVRHILEFKENLRVLLLAWLFILLSARVRTEDLGEIGIRSVIFVAVLVLVVRPVAVAVASMGTGLSPAVRRFLAGVAPRGIVAAAVTSALGLKLEAVGVEGAKNLAPLMFAVIVGTVTIYGLGAAPLARRLGLAVRNPQGVLIVGAHRFARSLAVAISKQGFRVVLVDTNRENVRDARLAGLDASVANVLADDARDRLDLGGLGRMFAMTPNDEANALMTAETGDLFGRDKAYRVAPAPGGAATGGDPSLARHGIVLFDPSATFQAITARVERGEEVRATAFTDRFSAEDFQAQNDGAALPLAIVTADKKLLVIAPGVRSRPAAGETLLSLGAKAAPVAPMTPALDTVRSEGVPA